MATPENGDVVVSIAWLEGDGVRLESLVLPVGSRLDEALGFGVARGVLSAAIVTAPGLRVAVFGRLRPPDYPLVAGDRIELLGPLQVDPKEARARRVALRRAVAGGR
jgi:putative ubiquitin-RnfH superfamily antitoxin RatB of RatAB toxin-antitoxin module